MSKIEITEKILADAENQKNLILEKANAQAQKILDEAKQKAQRYVAENKSRILSACKDIEEKSGASLRLETKKAELKFKNEVIDEIYLRALSKLKRLDNKRLLKLYEQLLTSYAEQGNTVFVSVASEVYDEIKSLKVFSDKNLVLSKERVKIEGGLVLSGEKTETVLSFENILAEDKANHLSDVATELFG